MNKQPDYYRILGIPPDATTAEIHKVARILAEKFPENARDPGVNAAYRQLLEAYEVLSDPLRRAEYDSKRARLAPELLEVTTQLSRRKIAAMDDEQLLYLLVSLRAPEQQAPTSLPLNLALVFDRSTSMAHDRLEKVKAAAREIVHKLSPKDAISIVTFSDRAEVVWAASRVEQRERIIGHISGIRASGGTEIFQGLEAGLQQLSRMPLERYINHLILMTDGQTYGDEEKCHALAQSAASRGITVSAFGIGSDWNDGFLDQVVRPSGGRCTYIETPAQIVGFLREQVNGLGAIYAHNVRHRFSLPGGIRCSYAMKLSPYALPLDYNVMPIQLGAVESRAPLSLLLELVVPPQRSGSELTIPLEFLVDIPSAQTRDRLFQYEENIRVEHDSSKVEPPHIVLKAVQMLNLHRINEKAWEDFEAGQTERATKRMAVLTTRLMEAGHPELAEQAELEKQRLRLMGTLSLEGRKRLKYGTRSLITTAVTFKGHD